MIQAIEKNLNPWMHSIDSKETFSTDNIFLPFLMTENDNSNFKGIPKKYSKYVTNWDVHIPGITKFFANHIHTNSIALKYI